jgi:hypothetical protein
LLWKINAQLMQNGKCVHPGPFSKEQTEEERGKMYALFVDFRVAFDKVHTEKMRERGISEWLVRKIQKIHARTKSKVKVGEKEGEC